MIGPDGVLPLPWLSEPLRLALKQRSHALLIHGQPGVGQFDLAVVLAQASLCETDAGSKPCGVCESCHLVQAHSHPDLLVIVPEALRDLLGFRSSDENGAGDEPSAKRKPSKDIRVDEIRQAIAFAQTTSARGRGKAVVIHPAERMNAVSANALLKTLEEPPGAARLLLASGAPDALLPTIRSRCQAVALGLPEPEVASAWLASRGVAQPEVMLAAAGGQPQEVLRWVEDGIDAAQWQALPRDVARGRAGGLAAWPLPRVVDTLQKLCHDAMRIAVGEPPRYFPPSAMPPPAPLTALASWAKDLSRIAVNVEHPLNVGLMVESLTERARAALSGRGRASGESAVSVNSIG